MNIDEEALKELLADLEKIQAAAKELHEKITAKTIADVQQGAVDVMFGISLICRSRLKHLQDKA